MTYTKYRKKQKMENNNKSLIKPAFKNYFKILGKSLPFLGFFTLVVIAVWLFEFVLTMYGYGLGFFNIILLGLVLVPLYFATQVCTYMIYRDGRDVPSQHFFNLFKLYFKPNFMGIYRIIRTLLLSILWSFLAVLGFSIVYSILSSTIDPALASAMETIASYIEAGDTEAAMNFMETSVAYSRFLDLIIYVSTTVESASFLFYMARNSAVMYVSEVVTAPSPRFVTEAYKNAFRGRHIPSYNKDFFKGTWFIFLFIVAMYALGSTIGYYVFLDNELQWLLMANLGQGFSLILLPFVLPYFLTFLTNLIERHKKGFVDSAFELVEISYQGLKERGMFRNDDDEAKYKDAMNHYKDEVNKGQEEEPIEAETKEKETDHINTDDYGSSDHH